MRRIMSVVKVAGIGLCLVAVASGTGVVVDTAVAQSAQAALNETITNSFEVDGSNSPIYISVIGGVFETINPAGTVTRNISSFTLPVGICAMVSYNYGTPQLRGPGTHSSFVDGVKLRIDPHRC